MTSSGPEPTQADALRAAAPPSDDIVAASARARVAASLFPSAAGDPASQTPLVGDRYEVARKIGSGGMGVVYEAFDPQLQRKVAVKVLHPDVAVDDRARKRMVREARSLAALSHPNVIGVHDVGEADDQVFVAMELVEGPTLRHFVEEHGRWEDALERYVQAGRGLAAAHAAGLVHRDFKPDNALVGADGRVRVLDFGLARRAQELTDERELGELVAGDSGPDDDDDDYAPTADGARSDDAPLAERPSPAPASLSESQLTDFGAVVGTPRYMAPEQFDAGVVDAKSDQFSFCVALYEALYQRRPYRAPHVAALAAKVVAGEFEPAPREGPVPAFIGDAIERGLSPKKADRWPTMDALLEVLEQAVERPGTPSISGVEIPSLPGVSAARSLTVWFAWSVALVALLLAGAVWFARQPDQLATVPSGQSRPEGGRDDAVEFGASGEGISESGGAADPTALTGTGGGLDVDAGGGTEADGSGDGRGAGIGIGPAPPATDDATGEDGAKARKAVARPLTDVCHMTEDQYRLIHRGKRRRYISTDDGCLQCRRRKSRTEVFIPNDCQAYMVCGPVSLEQCR